MHILGIDIGFANLGWVGIDTEGVVALAGDVIRTEKDDSKRKLEIDDNTGRTRIIFRGLRAAVEQVQPVVIVAEDQSWPRSASVAAKLGMAWGTLFSISALYNLPVVQVRVSAVKAAATAHKDASKRDVIAGVQRQVQGISPLLARLPAGRQPHLADAAGTVLASLDHDLILALRRTL